jgi:glycosyltransferase involved in cell wall biosynthesis
MDTKRNILIIMPSLRAGGAERTLINLLQKVDSSRFNVDLFVISRKGPYLKEIPGYVNTTFFFKNDFISRVFGYLHRKYNIALFYKKKMQAIEKTYDVGISYLDANYTDLLFYTDNIEKRVAFIHSSYKTHDNYDRFYSREEYNRKLRKNRYSMLDAIYFVSEDAMKEFVEVFGEYRRMDVIYNMIDRESILRKSNHAHREETESPFSFSAVGSLMKVKGFDRLIRAAGILKNEGYTFTIELAGAGEEEANLRRLIKSLCLEDTVFLRGFISNPYPLMKKSDVFVMSSISEALPTVLCEAMILGLPTLVTNCSGCRGLVNSGEFGLMAEQDDADLAEKMKQYLEQPNLLEHYRKKSMERSKQFDDERILNSYYEIFEGNI